MFTLVFLIYLNSQWFFLDRSSLTYIILRYLLVLQNYRNAVFVNLQLTPLECQKVKKNSNNEIDK